jgi:hypothetical protein
MSSSTAGRKCRNLEVASVTVKKTMLIPACVMLNLLASMRVSPLHFALLAAIACSDSNGLPDPTLTNVERTETLYALTGTPVGTPSGYALEGSRRVRTDASIDFDFAYNVEPDGRHVFLPRAAMGIEPNASLQPGFQARSVSFEEITEAPSNGYITEEVVPIAVGDRFVVRSRVTCAIGVPKYAKLEVTSLDATARTVTFRVLTNENCGYKGLQPGLPDV